LDRFYCPESRSLEYSSEISYFHSIFGYLYKTGTQVRHGQVMTYIMTLCSKLLDSIFQPTSGIHAPVARNGIFTALKIQVVVFWVVTQWCNVEHNHTTMRH